MELIKAGGGNKGRVIYNVDESPTVDTKSVSDVEYTVIWFEYGIYHQYKVKVKKTMNFYGLTWNRFKGKDLSADDVKSIFEFFGVIDKLNEDENLKGRGGSSGVWEFGDEAVKAIMFEKKNEEEHLPLLMIYKGKKSNFYNKFIDYLVGIGCEISNVSDVNGKYEKALTVKKNKYVDNLKDTNSEKKMLEKMFTDKVKVMREMGYNYTDEFVKGWVKCIYEFGDCNNINNDSLEYDNTLEYDSIINKNVENKDYNENMDVIKDIPVNFKIKVHKKL